MKMEKLLRSSIDDPPKYPLRILQFGGGNFLRAFLGWIVEILNEETEWKGSIALVKPTSFGSYEILKAQQGLYHVQLQGIREGVPASEVKRIHCVREVLNPYTDWEGFLDLAGMDTIRYIVSNTTEAGIFFDPDSGPDDRPPLSFPAKLTCWLYRRYQHFKGDPAMGCTILPCELIEANGSQLRDIILKHASAWNLEPQFRDWVKEANIFCNTLVDRIVSGFPEALAEEVWEETGYEDPMLVSAEYYHSWVIEGGEAMAACFPTTTTPVNVKFVPDLRPYRELKVRILNGTHTLMVALGLLAGVRYVHECMEDPVISQFLEEMIKNEIGPVLDMPRQEVEAFADAVITRFRNPFLCHELVSISLNSTAKFKTRVLPLLQAYQHTAKPTPQRILLAFAAFIYCFSGRGDSQGIVLKENPETYDHFRDIWKDYQPTPADALEVVNRVLEYPELKQGQGPLLQGFRKPIAAYLAGIEQAGVREGMRALTTI